MSAASVYAMLFVLAMSAAGGTAGMALFMRRERMPLYEVKRTDTVQPGEFDNALVIAGGTARARAAVAHLLPKGAKVEALRIETANQPTQLLSTYFDEREVASTADEYAGDVSAPGAWTF